MSAKAISAIYPDHKSAIKALHALKTHGFANRDISILMSEKSADLDIKIEQNSKAPEGALAGAGVGGAVGATLAGLTAVGTITLTGGAALLAAGPVVATLAGAGAGATVGGAIGSLFGAAVPETEAKLTEERLSKGYVMLGVSIDEDREKEVKTLLKKANPDSITIH